MVYKESETLELKSSFKEWKEIIISLVAFVITFFKEKVKEGINEGIREGINGGIREGINGGIKEGIKLLLYTIKEKPGKRTNELAELLQISPKTMEKWIKKLKQQEKIVFKGSKKTGGYFVK